MASITRPTRQTRRRADSEAAVLAATERLLQAGATFTELGVQRIAAEAGVARSTFYLCFRDKTDLLIRLTAHMKEELFRIGGDWRPTGPDGGPDGLTAIYVEQLRYYRERGPLLAAIAEVAAYDAEMREARAREIDRFTRHITLLIEAEQEAGRLHRGVDAATAAQVLAWGGEQVIARQVAIGDPARDEAVARDLAESQWYGTYRRPEA
ncbi:TetR/AcrR family transcriptional regulator [Streptomyces sp. NPDC001070]